MSIHMLECAARMDLPAGKKLALMAFADSADRATGLALPGFDEVQLWSGLGRSQCAAVVAELVAQGLLRKHRGGHRGRRAEYQVFPDGCCDQHRPHPVDNPAHTEPNGSAESAPTKTNESGQPDPSQPDATPPVDNPTKGSDQTDPTGEKGSGKGPTATGPLPYLQEQQPPLSPTQPCGKHRTTPGTNCRACGTSPRQVAERQHRADQATERASPRCRHPGHEHEPAHRCRNCAADTKAEAA